MPKLEHPPVLERIRTIGFVGTGIMGGAMAAHLLRAGYELRVHNRTRARAEALVSAGATWARTAAEAASEADLVITVVGYPKDVEEVFLGSAGLLKRARPGTIAVDMSTSRPKLAQYIAMKGAEAGVSVLDAPVTGGDVGARNATLSIMVGGDAAAYQRAFPVLQKLGNSIVHHGPAGAGQHAKMCNQIAIASGIVGVCEALAYAKRTGLAADKVLQSTGLGAASSWQLTNLGPRMVRGDFAPGFQIRHFLKDMAIALEAAREMDLDLPGLALAKRLYERLSADGGASGDLGTQTLFRLYEKD